jgi:hypothetical protein
LIIFDAIFLILRRQYIFDTRLLIWCTQCTAFVNHRRAQFPHFYSRRKSLVSIRHQSRNLWQPTKISQSKQTFGGRESLCKFSLGTRVARWFILNPKIPSFCVNFGSLVCNGRCCYVLWYILRPIGKFYGHSVHFVAIWYIFSRFGILCKEKSSNPVGCYVFFAVETSNAKMSKIKLSTSKCLKSNCRHQNV